MRNRKLKERKREREIKRDEKRKGSVQLFYFIIIGFFQNIYTVYIYIYISLKFTSQIIYLFLRHYFEFDCSIFIL
jgi:hypothetical protein